MSYLVVYIPELWDASLVQFTEDEASQGRVLTPEAALAFCRAMVVLEREGMLSGNGMGTAEEGTEGARLQRSPEPLSLLDHVRAAGTAQLPGRETVPALPASGGATDDGGDGA